MNNSLDARPTVDMFTRTLSPPLSYPSGAVHLLACMHPPLWTRFTDRQSCPTSQHRHIHRSPPSPAHQLPGSILQGVLSRATTAFHPQTSRDAAPNGLFRTLDVTDTDRLVYRIPELCPRRSWLMLTFDLRPPSPTQRQLAYPLFAPLPTEPTKRRRTVLCAIPFELVGWCAAGAYDYSAVVKLLESRPLVRTGGWRALGLGCSNRTRSALV